MSDILSNRLKFSKLDVPSGIGYSISFNNGREETVCAVVVDEDGHVTATSGKPRGNDKSFDVKLALVDDVADPRADVPWAYAMFGAANAEHLMEKLGIPFAYRDEVRGGFEDSLIIAGVDIAARIDQRACGVLSNAHAKRLGTLAFYSGDSERAVTRRQAAEQYPLLADLLSSNLSAKMAIDRRKPLAETVTLILAGLTDLPVTKPVLKRIAAAGQVPMGCDLETVIRFMSLVPVDWVPSRGPEWDSFCHAAHALLVDLKCRDDDVVNLTKGCGGKWTDFCSRIAKKAGIEDTDVRMAARRAMFNAADMIDCFADVVVLPLAAHASPSSEIMVTPEMLHTGRNASFEMVASGRNAPDIADLQRRWHQERATILAATEFMREERRQAIVGTIGENAWPGLTEPVQAPNGLWLVPLVNPIELMNEGSEGPDARGVLGLHHCVGGYASRAVRCDCHIVSVRTIDENGDYKRVSTVEFNALQPGSNKLTERQNMANGNTTPSAESKDAVTWYMSMVENGEIPIDREKISAFLDKQDVPDDGIERICGYDWRDADMLHAVVGPWGHFVLSDFRKLNLDGLMDTTQVQGVTALVSPEMLLSSSR